MLDFTLRPCDCLTSETSENRARRPSQIYNRVKGNVFKTLRPTAAEQWKMFWEKRVQRPGLPSSLRLAKGKAIPGDFRLTANTFVVCDVTAYGLCMRTEKKPQHTQNDRYHGSRNNKTIRRTGPLLSSRSLVRFRKTCKFSYKYTIPTLLLVYLTIHPILYREIWIYWWKTWRLVSVSLSTFLVAIFATRPIHQWFEFQQHVKWRDRPVCCQKISCITD